jgi:hypothetical protein
LKAIRATAQTVSRVWQRCLTAGGTGGAVVSQSITITKKERALLKEASEMFDETGCVPGIDGEQVPAERIVPDVKKYISETISPTRKRGTTRRYGMQLALCWSFRGLHKNGTENASSLHPTPAKHDLTKEQQKACLDLAATELIREIKQRRPLN